MHFKSVNFAVSRGGGGTFESSVNATPNPREIDLAREFRKGAKLRLETKII
jgi:hypothetical protein